MPSPSELGTDGTVKLLDLGLLARSGRSGAPIQGSVLYMAPERIRQAAIDGRTDLYALGALMYHMACGHPPFEQAETLATLRAHLETRPQPLNEWVPGIAPALALATAGAPDLATFMAPVANLALALVGAERCYLVQGAAHAAVFGCDRQGLALDLAAPAISQTVCQWVLDHGESLYLSDAQEDQAFAGQKSVMALALRMVHAIPVVQAGRCLGVLVLHGQRIERDDRTHVALLERVGELIGAYLVRTTAS